MKTILSSRRHHYVARAGIFLIAIALIVVMVGCNGGGGGVEYDLTMAVAPPGSGTATDLTNTSPYAVGTVVSIKAVAAAGYQFVNWTAPAGTFANANAAHTNFTMPAQNVTATANFVAVYDLTMAANPEIGGTATDLTNASPYTAGTDVNIKAVAAAGYEFVSWTAPAGTFADANAAQTNFTMPAQQVTVTANFFQGQLIRDWQDLHAIRDDIGDNYLLMNDLDSTTAGYTERASPTANGGKGWQPIGSLNASYDPVDPFTGTFDGQGYEIRDLFIDRPDEDGVGLFGAVVGAVIENVGMVDADVTGDVCVGGLVGVNFGTVNSSYATGSVDGFESVGGLVGYNEGSVNSSYATGSVAGVGVSDSVGGLVGYNDDTISACHATGNVTGAYEVGGLVGYNEGSVNSSYATGDVTGAVCVGGLVGFNYEGSVESSYATGNVNGGGSGGYVGGLVGYNYEGSVDSSYANGSVTGLYDVGGLVGYNEGTVSDSFWDTQTSGQATSSGGTGKTTEEMMDIDTFTDAETEGLDEPWDIIAVDNSNERDTDYVWNIVDDMTYPFLSWQPV